MPFLRNNIPYYLLLALCALLPFQFALNPAPGFDLAIVRVIIPLLFLSWAIISLKNKTYLLLLNKMTFLFALLFILATVSLFFSHNLFWSLRKLFFLFSIVPVYFIASSILTTRNKQRVILTALVGGASALAIVAIVQFASQFIFGIDPVYTFLAQNITPFFLGNSFSQAVLAYPSWLVDAGGTTYMRALAIFPDPHMLSYYFGILIPWSIALWITSKKYSRLFLISSIFLIVADVCTFTRGGYIALIAGALVTLPLVSRSTGIKIITASAMLALLFMVVPHNPVAGRLISSFDINEGSNIGRISNWQQARTIIAAHPFGVGIGMYSLAVDPNADYREPVYAHNLYLDIAAELGVVAAIVFMAILFFAFISFWQAAKKDAFFIAGVSSITVFSIHSLVETPIYSVHILPLICIIIALSTLTAYYEKTDNA